VDWGSNSRKAAVMYFTLNDDVVDRMLLVQRTSYCVFQRWLSRLLQYLWARVARSWTSLC
jgi:hypothetical protein